MSIAFYSLKKYIGSHGLSMILQCDCHFIAFDSFEIYTSQFCNGEKKISLLSVVFLLIPFRFFYCRYWWFCCLHTYTFDFLAFDFLLTLTLGRCDDDNNVEDDNKMHTKKNKNKMPPRIACCFSLVQTSGRNKNETIWRIKLNQCSRSLCLTHK